MVAEEAPRVRDHRAAARGAGMSHNLTGMRVDNLQLRAPAQVDAGSWDGVGSPAASAVKHRGAPLQSRRGNHAQQRYPPSPAAAADNKCGCYIPPRSAVKSVLPARSISSWRSFSVEVEVRPVAFHAALYFANTGLRKVLLLANNAIRCESYLWS